MAELNLSKKIKKLNIKCKSKLLPLPLPYCGLIAISILYMTPSECKQALFPCFGKLSAVLSSAMLRIIFQIRESSGERNVFILFSLHLPCYVT